MRVLFCHPKKDWTAEDIAESAAIISGATGADVVSGRDAYQRYFTVCGRNWSRWTVRMGCGTGLDGAPIFDMYVVPGEYCAKATAQIVGHALAVGRPVLVWDRDAPGDYGKFRRVTRVQDTRPDDLWHGWVLRSG